MLRFKINLGRNEGRTREREEKGKRRLRLNEYSKIRLLSSHASDSHSRTRRWQFLLIVLQK